MTIESQAELWNGPSGERWTREQERLDRAFEGIDAIGLAAAAAAAGEHVVDIGCGCGASTVQLAARVGATGSVHGVDISASMLARARQRTATFPWVALTREDATRHRFERKVDLLYSRFGVMFFENPSETFHHLRSGLRKSGRACFVVWRAPEDNPWLVAPLRAAERVLPPAAAGVTGGPGPFSLAAGGATRDLLERAGFEDVVLTPHDLDIVLSASGVEDAIDFALDAGPIARRLASIDDTTRAQVRRAVGDVLGAHVDGLRVSLPAGIWVVNGRVRA